MRRAIAIVGSVELWALCCLTGCVAIPEAGQETSGELADASDVARLELDGGSIRPPTGAPYTGLQCPTQPLGGGQDGGVAHAGAGGVGGNSGDPSVPGAGTGGDGDAGSVPDNTPAAPRPMQAGDLVITELMVDPNALRDDVGEWIELWNATATSLELTGCTIDDGGKTPRAISELIVPAMGVVTIARSLEVGFVPDATTAISLSNSADTVALVCDGVEIDRVTYGAGFPLAAGTSMSLDEAAFDAVENDRADRWCAASEIYAVDRGTPGSRNASCFEVADAGSDAGL